MDANTVGAERFPGKNQLSKRYPLFSTISADVGAGREPLPQLISLLSALAESDQRQAICLVIPNASVAANLTAILLAIHKINRSSANQPSQICEIKLGTRVRVLPSGYVYEFQGPMPGYPQFLKLGILNSRGGSRTMPAGEIGRLQPTDASRPLGDGKSDLGKFQKSPLDLLADTALGGNTGAIHNEVIVFGYRTTFEAVITETKLIPDITHEFPALFEFLPWGRIRGDGTSAILNPPSAHGAPLIGVSSEPQNVVRACENVPQSSVVVIADGPSALVNNLQDFDRITELQKLLVFCKPQDREKARILQQRGALIWEVHADEAAPGEMRRKADRKSQIGKILRQLESLDKLTFQELRCRSDSIESIAVALEKASGADGGGDDAFRMDEILRSCFGLLNLIAEYFDVLPGEGLGDLQSRFDKLDEDFKACAIWLSPDHHKRLSHVVEAFRELLKNPELISGAPKGEQILNGLNNCPAGTRTAVITRSIYGVERLSRLIGEASGVEIFPAASVPEQDFEKVLIVSWPGRYIMTKLLNAAITADIQMVGYPFECRWFECLVTRFNNEILAGNVSAEMRSKLLGTKFDSESVPHWQRKPVGSHGTSEEEETGPVNTAEVVLDFEERLRELRPQILQQTDAEPRDATFVRFVGSSSAYFTEWHSVPWLNPLFGEGSGSKGVPTRYVSQMQLGDYLLFREGADKDVVRYVAETMIGEKKYGTLRDVADLWRPALNGIASDPWKIWSILSKNGLRKGEATVRGWVLDPNRIGPGNQEDYEVISRVTPDRIFPQRWREVWDAVRKVRRLHIRAGHQLSEILLKNLPVHLDEIGAQETRLDLGFGQVWIVQVDHVANKVEEVPWTVVNKLIWDETESNDRSFVITSEDLSLD